MKKTYLIPLIVLLAAGCAHFGQKDVVHLQEGAWRGVLSRQDGVVIPFNFEIKDTDRREVMYVVNGAGRMRVDSLRYQGDTVFIHMPFFNSDFWAHVQNDGSLKGEWVKHDPDSDRVMGFSATPHTDFRITGHAAASRHDLTGRWRTRFISQDQDTLNAVGEFKQSGDQLTGTFLTQSGDYRYLQGIVDGDTLKLSTFDGSHVFLFKALAGSDSTLRDGVFYSGFEGRSRWSAVKDESARLPDAFSLTYFKPGENKLDFSFPDLNGDTISIQDPRFKNKVVIVQIMGSWCPNCMDETDFLSSWYRQHKSKDLAIVGLCYEQSTDFKEAVKGVLTFKDRFQVTYPLLITGVTPGDPQLLDKTLPQLQHFVGFPTTIFLDKKGDIAKIHAGFSGPGTGPHYLEFIGEFNDLVNRLLAE